MDERRVKMFRELREAVLSGKIDLGGLIPIVPDGNVDPPVRIIGVDLGEGSYIHTIEQKVDYRPASTNERSNDLSIEDIRENATEAEFTIVDGNSK